MNEDAEKLIALLETLKPAKTRDEIIKALITYINGMESYLDKQHEQFTEHCRTSELAREATEQSTRILLNMLYKVADTDPRWHSLLEHLPPRPTMVQ